MPHKGKILSLGSPPYSEINRQVPSEIMKKMGEVFLLRSNIASVGSVLDSPEVFWVCSTDRLLHRATL